jgi:hypothetical protein
MLFGVGTLHLDFNRTCPGAIRRRNPGIASKPERIDGIRNHRQAETQVILRNRISHPVPRVVGGYAAASWRANCRPIDVFPAPGKPARIISTGVSILEGIPISAIIAGREEVRAGRGIHQAPVGESVTELSNFPFPPQTK